jgi:hypothetical protein
MWIKTERGDPIMQARQVLHKLLQKVCAEMHKLRRTALLVNVMAALHGEVLTVTHLGRAIRSEAKEKHCIKRADRLLSNRRLQGERVEIYSALTQQLIGTKQRPVIIVDWSDMDECKRHFLLRASVPIEGRSLTLYEEVHTVKSMEKPKVHEHFLQTLQKMLPPHCRPILVTDAGFRTPWFKQVEALGWDWVGRIRNRHEVQLPGEAQWIPCKSLYGKATSTPKAFGRACVTESNPIACQLILYKAKPKGRVHFNCFGQRVRSSHSRKHEQAQREPWLLGTSLPEGFKLAEKVVKLYALRMQIEEAFSGPEKHPLRPQSRITSHLSTRTPASSLAHCDPRPDGCLAPRQGHPAHRTTSSLSGQYGAQPCGPLHDISWSKSHRRPAGELVLGRCDRGHQ